ncbi:MAG: hypothetical protein PHT58_08840 [Eubacteriales bacterium]|nr:hypothetical protein [Eubacteriales bacterium]
MKQDQPKAYTWVFTEGAKIILRTDEDGIVDSDLDHLRKLDQWDANDSRRYRRHNVSLESASVYSEKSYLWMDTHADFQDSLFDRLEEQYWHERLVESIALLSSSQIRLLEQVYLEALSLREIARREGVCDNVIRKKLKGILKKLKRNFP